MVIGLPLAVKALLKPTAQSGNVLETGTIIESRNEIHSDGTYSQTLVGFRDNVLTTRKFRWVEGRRYLISEHAQKT
jgi:hypothetical protein